MENEDKLKHASSRKVFLKDNKVVKFYPHIYGYLFHDLVFMGFSLFFFHIMVPISIKNKIRNEIEGRKTLKKMGIKTTKLRFFSEKSLGEEFEAGASTIDDLELSNPRKAFHVVKKNRQDYKKTTQ